MKSWLLWTIFIGLSLLTPNSFTQEGPKAPPGYTQEAFSQLRTLLANNSNDPFTVVDFAGYEERLHQFNSKEKMSFNQKDAILHTFYNLKKPLLEKLFYGSSPSWQNVEIVLHRKAPAILHEIANSHQVPASVQVAAKLSIYGTTHTPAIISEDFVNTMAGQSSAFSTMNAEKSIIYEGYRPSTYNALVISHEGFHSAMRRLSNLNRLNRLSQFIEVPVANGAKYSVELDQAINLLESAVAPGLGALSVDERFTSDHHGTIMAVTHHGIYQAMVDGHVSNEELETFDTDYPFHYISQEKAWTPFEKEKAKLQMRRLHQRFLQENQKMETALSNIESHLSLYL